MNKIFCIGHFKTGTTSYSLAMRMLGFVDLHFPLKYAEQLMATGDVFWNPTYMKKIEGFEPVPVSRHWDSMSNINEIEYRQCDMIYQDSKFVLTTRPVESWLKSIRKHMVMAWPPRLKRLLDWRSMVVFGCRCDIEEFEEEHFRRTYLRHKEEAQDYFSGRSGQLFLLDLESPTKMEDLSRFLGKKVPYPRMNTSAEPEVFAAPGMPLLVRDRTREGYPEVPTFLQFEELVKW